jgi:isopentenyl phosphate kinase
METMKNLIILKIGGSILTKKDQPFTANMENLQRLALEIAEAYKPKKMKLVLIHGAGSFGHYIAEKTGIHKGMKTHEDAVAFGVTQKWQNYWNSIVVTELNKHGLPAMPVQASAFSVLRDNKLVWMPMRTIKELLKLGMIPVLYGVPAVDIAQGCCILSGDQILSWIADKLKPEKIIHATDVDGIFTDDPRKNPGAQLIKKVDLDKWDELKSHLSGSSSVDVTGGMFGKIHQLTGLSKTGLRCEIINANKEGFVSRALSGEEGLGTSIR